MRYSLNTYLLLFSCSLFLLRCTHHPEPNPLSDLGSTDEGFETTDGMSDAMSDAMSGGEERDAAVSTTEDQGELMADQELDTGSSDSETDLEPVQVDEDGDGYPSETDCDDQDPDVFPGAGERCNQIDDDCDQSIDEGEMLPESSTWYRDQDRDRFGDPLVSIVSCDQPSGYVDNQDDCDDQSDQINPLQDEICDGVDNDCAEGIDDGIITDGAGCLDPGYPSRSPTAQSAHLTIRNGNNAGDDGSLEVEFTDGSRRLTRSLNNVSWDDHMRHTVDVYAVDLNANNFTHNGLGGGRVTIRYDDSDAWAIACAQIHIDGILVSCEDFGSATITLERGARETLNVNLPNPLPNESLRCSCVDRYLSHGPIIGAVGHNSVRIWGRTDAMRRVELRVGSSESQQTVAYRYPSPERDYTFTVDLQGLAPSTEYHYTVLIEDQETTGTFSTAPSPGQSGEYKFAVGSCAKTVPSRHPEQPIFGAIIDDDPDLMLMLGDNVYFDSLTNGDAPDVGAMRSYYRDAIRRTPSWVGPYRPPLSVYDPSNPSVRPSSSSRARWWGVFGRDQRADLFASTPTLAIWDDHDFYSNNADAYYDDDRGRKAWTYDAIRMFKEYWPNPDGGQSQTDVNLMGIYFKQSYGDIDFFGLDTRFHRDDSREVMLGRAQMDWIKRELSDSTATFKFVMSGSIFGGPSSDDEKWPHFVADRAELFNHIWDEEISGVILMSGDIHISSILEHERPNLSASSYPLYEIISSGLANYGPSNPSSSDYGSIIQMRYMPPFSYNRARTTVFARVSANTTLEDPTISVDFIDENGDSACADCPFVIRRSQLTPL